MVNTVGSLTQLQRSLIVGTILGDGYVRIVSGRKNALLEINHTYSQKDYVDWKFQQLKPLCKSGPVARKGNGERIAYRFTTRQSEEMSEIYHMFYHNKVKTVPKDLELDDVMLAVWYMDDGGKCGEDNVYLNTQQFDLNVQEELRGKLKKLGIETTLNKDKIYWRIRIKKSSVDKFFSIISRNIIPSMQYKLSYSPVETRS
jgi:hypothetical protein